MRIRSIKSVALIAALMVTAFVSSSFAQSPRLYASTRQMQTLLNRIETRTDQFRSEMQRSVSADDRTTNREERIMDLISDFESATDTLRLRVTSRAALTGEVDEVYDRARRINNFMLRNRPTSRATSQWNSIRTDLNTLASYYRLSWTWDRDDMTPIGGGTTFPVSDADFRATVTRIERNTDTFRRQMDTILSRQERPRRDEMNSYIGEFERATNELTNRFNNRRATEADVREVLNRGANIDRFMSRNAFARNAENQWRTIRGDLDRLAGYYRVSWNWENAPITGGGWSSNPGYATLEGTYRLNRSRSDNVSTVIDRSVNGMSGNRDNMRRNLERRLESPEMIAFDTSGTSVTMATSNSARATFEANGVGTTETNPRGRTVTTTATLDRNGLQVNYAGDRINDFNVRFTPVGNDRLTVTRQIYLEGRNESITVTSQYDRVSGTADWSAVNAGPAWDNNAPSNGDFYIANGTRLTATLNSPLKTRVSQVGDRFSMTVTSPSQYSGAVIEGRVVEAASSGRITGRANMSLAFDSIRINGRNYSFAGMIDGVRAANGDSVSINNEGVIRDGSQTNRTVTRAGVGAVIGAIIGAIAGGGEGAAIGAGVGAGAGAGSILLGGRDSIELDAGSTFEITASAPANTRAGRY